MQHSLFIDKSEVVSWIKSNKPSSQLPKTAPKLRYVDLFCGCGGLSYGIEKAALEFNVQAMCALAIDSKESALNVYKDNILHEEGAIKNVDITEVFGVGSNTKEIVSDNSILNGIGKIDILVAGPPCQGHSNLNNSTRRNDPRNNLYLACVNAVEILNPSLVIIENVTSVIHSKENVVELSENKLKKLGYYCRQIRVDFLNLGIPQSRKRHVLIASKNKKFIDSIALHLGGKQIPKLTEFLSDLRIDKDSIMFDSGRLSSDNNQRVNYLFDTNEYDLPDRLRPKCHREKSHSYKSVYGRLDWNKPAQTLTSGYGSMGQGRYIHPSEKRTLNSREASRIQGFPDYYSFSTVKKVTDLRVMIANAVPPQLSFRLTQMFLESTTNIKPEY